MTNSYYFNQITARRTFAIISHPDAGKTTITEKILLLGQVIKTAGSIKSRGSNKYAKSDWMEIEKQRGISVTTSVMQFPYQQVLINLLDTPGHGDFCEDTYRTLMAIDFCLIIIDATKGVEEQTHKLMEVTRLRRTPIIIFMNKIDRYIRDPIELLYEVEGELGIICTPITWPIGYGKQFKGVYHLVKNETYLYQSGQGHTIQEVRIIKGLNNKELDLVVGEDLAIQLRKELEIVQLIFHPFHEKFFLIGELTPVFFGTALGNFGINYMLDSLISWSLSPMSRSTNIRIVRAEEKKFTGFVFKIQANMDPRHRDRVAFLRIVSGRYEKNMKLYQVRTGKNIVINNALIFMAGSRTHTEDAYAGDIIGLQNHGNIHIGDTFTQGEKLKFTGISSFAPEFFRRIRLQNPIKQKQLLKGLIQLSEEGSIQIFRPVVNNDLIIGAVGILQFDVIVSRLRNEYSVEVMYELVNVYTARWITCSDNKKLEIFKRKNKMNLALDGGNNLIYIAPSMVNLNLTQERYPHIQFYKTRDI